jgi:hypothetical protein
MRAKLFHGNLGDRYTRGTTVVAYFGGNSIATATIDPAVAPARYVT